MSTMDCYGVHHRSRKDSSPTTRTSYPQTFDFLHFFENASASIIGNVLRVRFILTSYAIGLTETGLHQRRFSLKFIHLPLKKFILSFVRDN